MLKKILKGLCKYFFYLVFSFGLGYVSMLGETDYIADFSGAFIPILMTLMALYAAISGQLILRLRDSNLDKEGLAEVVDAMERSVVIEVLLIAFSFVIFVSSSWIIALIGENTYLLSIWQLFRNALVCFVFMYFVYVVYDSTVGLYHLLKM